MVTMGTNEDCLNEEFISGEDSLMFIDEGSDELGLCQEDSLNAAVCRKKCIVRLDNARYTIADKPLAS
ncbi:hypothetical protein ACF0H5_023624 [Mactra antiquata]